MSLVLPKLLSYQFEKLLSSNFRAEISGIILSMKNEEYDN